MKMEADNLKCAIRLRTTAKSGRHHLFVPDILKFDDAAVKPKSIALLEHRNVEHKQQARSTKLKAFINDSATEFSDCRPVLMNKSVHF